MNESLQEIIGWGYPVVSIILIVVASTRRKLPGRPWLIAYLAIGLAEMVAWRMPRILGKFDSLDFDPASFYDFYALPLNFVGLAGYCLLIPFLFAVAGSFESRVGHGASDRGIGEQQSMPATGDTTNPLHGVHGWLKLFVVVNMYVAPVLFAVGQIVGFIGVAMMVEDYPGIVVVGVIEAAVGIFFVVKWIMIARRLRDIASGVIQEVKKWLLITLAWNVLSIPLLFVSGLDAEDVMFGAVKQLFLGIIAFAIWYSYFNVSRRVQATYADWDK